MSGSHEVEDKSPAIGGEVAAVPESDILTSLAAGRADCDSLIARINALLARRCAGKVNVLPHAADHAHTGCRCSGSGGNSNGPFRADVIVLIDTSGSMTIGPNPQAPQISAATAAAVEAALAHCKVDLRIAYMGVEGIVAGTVFTTNYLAYLKALLNPDPVFSTDNPPGGFAGPEEGANAIEDLSRYYDWRPEACRAILYISDEKLDGNTSNQAGSAAATAQAIAAANANGVTVFANFISQLTQPPWVKQQYQDLCAQTGGQLFVSPTASKEEFQKILADVICGACGRPRCRPAAIPKLEPCISIKWGDSRCDCFETDDVEVVCVTVCNCYSNVTFSNFRIATAIVTLAGGGAVPTLPDGSPSVQMVPVGPVCFGDIPPCRDDKAGCVSREYVIRTRGARGGRYEVRLVGICYDVCFHYDQQDAFALTLCPD